MQIVGKFKKKKFSLGRRNITFVNAVDFIYLRQLFIWCKILRTETNKRIQVKETQYNWDTGPFKWDGYYCMLYSRMHTDTSLLHHSSFSVLYFIQRTVSLTPLSVLYAVSNLVCCYIFHTFPVTCCVMNVQYLVFIWYCFLINRSVLSSFSFIIIQTKKSESYMVQFILKCFLLSCLRQFLMQSTFLMFKNNSLVIMFYSHVAHIL